jgi:hypothetical protein
MEKEYKIEESATNKPRLIHRSSFTVNPTPIVPATGSKAFRSSFTGKSDKNSSQVRINPSSFASNSLPERILDLCKKPTTDSLPPLLESDSTNSSFQELIALTDPMQKSSNASQEVTKSRSTTDSESITTEDNLKDKLAASLSPSPFRDEDPNMREARLDHLVASSPSTTKTILFYPFYGTEQMGEANHHAWKIALKDHIVHTLESICLINNLNTVPEHSIEKRMLPANTWTSITLT